MIPLPFPPNDFGYIILGIGFFIGIIAIWYFYVYKKAKEPEKEEPKEEVKEDEIKGNNL